jgi:quinol monooxygenase YgiN
MIHVIVKVNIASDKVPEVLPVGQSLAHQSSKEVGCIYYNFVKAEEAEDVGKDEYYIVEKYVDQEALDLHNKSYHFLTLVPELQEKGAEIVYIKKAIEVSSGVRLNPLPVFKSRKKFLRLMISLTVVKDEEKFLALAKKMCEVYRERDGCLDFTFAKVLDSAENEYLFIEEWANEEALANHGSDSSYLRHAVLLGELTAFNAVRKAYVLI